MENLVLLILGFGFWYMFFGGPHTKSSKPKDDKKGGDKGGKK